MLLRLALPLLELPAAAVASWFAVSAAYTLAPIEMAIAGMAALSFGLLRSIAVSQAAGRRFDAAMSGLRTAPPSNDAGGR